MDYILIGNDKDVTNVLKEQRIRINRGMIQLIPLLIRMWSCYRRRCPKDIGMYACREK